MLGGVQLLGKKNLLDGGSHLDGGLELLNDNQSFELSRKVCDGLDVADLPVEEPAEVTR